MTTKEFYYLMLVLGAFGAGMVIATLQYKAASRAPAPVAVTRRPVARAA